MNSDHDLNQRCVGVGGGGGGGGGGVACGV